MGGVILGKWILKEFVLVLKGLTGKFKLYQMLKLEKCIDETKKLC